MFYFQGGNLSRQSVPSELEKLMGGGGGGVMSRAKVYCGNRLSTLIFLRLED